MGFNFFHFTANWRITFCKKIDFFFVIFSWLDDMQANAMRTTRWTKRGALSGCVPLLLAIYEQHRHWGRAIWDLWWHWGNGGGSASSTVVFFFGLGFVQVQCPHLPHDHALRQGALGKALAGALLAHLVASAALFPQHVRHIVACFGACLWFNERFFFFKNWFWFAFIFLQP